MDTPLPRSPGSRGFHLKKKLIVIGLSKKAGIIIMMISTRGRYALRVIIDLAENSKGDYIPMKIVAERQGISLKYLERILPLLVSANMVEGIHGKGGGYRLSRDPGSYTVGEILRVTEGDIAPVSCLECNAETCDREDTCRTLPMWTRLNDLINNYLDSVTIKDLMEESQGQDS